MVAPMSDVDQEQAARQMAELEWRGDTPVSTRFDDPYFSLADGLAETNHVFLKGNQLPERLTPGFTIAELGFGTGLNLAAVLAVAECPIRFITFEAFPMTGTQAMAALRAVAPVPMWMDRIEAIGNILDQRSEHAQIGPVEVEVHWGDVRKTLPNWSGCADAWFLDGFSPAKNPEMWGADLMAEVGEHTVPGGTFATFTAAGAVRRALENAGFNVERVGGYGRKRHMSRGVKH